MAEIRAFVGHSFTDDDEIVVDRFLKYFDQLSNLLPDFSWVHAKAAEPAELRTKVLRLVGDCNTFIALCTKKELVTQQSNLKPRWFGNDTFAVSADDFVWKTSDWIIQELGLAVGRGMSIIVLLEAGCRRPGGLQGDTEFIPFERSYPERAFGQLLEMIQALNPSATAALPIAPEDGRKPEEEPQGSPPEADETPDATWDASKYEDAFFWKLIRRKQAEAEKINDAYLASEHAPTDDKQAEWFAKAERLRITFGSNGHLSKLRDLYLANRANPRVIESYAAALSFFDHYEDAAKLYLEALEFSKGEVEKRSQQIAAIIQLAHAGQPDRAFSLLDDLRANAIGSAEAQSSLAYCMKSLSSVLKDDQLEIEAMEKLVAINPDDYDTRFSLAYAHSQLGNEDMALEHYLAIPYDHRSSTAWNNLGVAFQHFSAPARAVDAYRMAADSDETLAMSNLAYKLLQAGFLKEARAELDRAMSLDDPHRNVGEAYSALVDIPGKETKKIDGVRESTKVKADFYKELGKAILAPNLSKLRKRWSGPDCDLEIEIVGRTFHARGQYSVTGNALAGLLGTKTQTEYKLEFSGTVVGLRVFGEVERTPVKEQVTSLLGDLDKKKKFSIIFDESLIKARVVEDFTSRSPRYYEISEVVETANDESLSSF